MVYISTGKGYEHYNRAMGKWITSKAHYKEEMKKGGYVTEGESNDMVASWESKHKTSYKPSKDCHEIIETLKHKADKKGNVKMPEKCVEKLEEMGMTFDADKIMGALEDE